MKYRDYDYERDEEPNFRCPGCEVNNGTGRYCQECLADEVDYRQDPEPRGGWHPPSKGVK
jgi:hypothetical protein